MRKIAVLLVALAACRSLNESDPTTHAAPHAVTMEEHSAGTLNNSMFVELATDYHAPVTTIAAPVDRVWNQVVTFYGNSGLPVTRLEADKHHIAIEGANVKRTLLGQPMSKWFDCGIGAGGVRRVDNARIIATIESIVAATPDGQTQLLTSVRGRGVDDTGSANNAVPCESTGALEEYLSNQIKLNTAAQGQ